MIPEYVSGLVSVIVPVRNRESLIVHTLESIANQSYAPIEIIVVDDGSTDGTGEVITTWCGNKRNETLNLRCFYQPHHGAPAARNLGLRVSQGQFIQFLDSDDIIHPEKLSIQVQALRNSTCKFVWSATGSFLDTPNYEVEPFSGRYCAELLPEFIYAPVWVTSSGLYTREICIKIGPWNEQLSIWQDWEYNLRLVCLDSSVTHVPGVLSLHRHHSLGRINDTGATEQGIKALLIAAATFESILANKFGTPSPFEHDLGLLYYRIACHARKHGIHSQAEIALRLASERVSRKTANLKLRTLLLCYRLFGDKFWGTLAGGLEALNASLWHWRKRKL